MKHPWLIALAAAGALLMLIALTFRADAEPPPSGWYGGFSKPMIVCDTKDQIVAIVEAGAKDGSALVAKFRELYATLDARHFPTCIIGMVNEVAVGESVALADAYSPEGNLNHTWAIHAGTMSYEFWLLYAEKITPEDKGI